MKLTTLTPVLLALTSGITALEIKFIRYSRRGCTSDAYHIAADTNLENPYCKTFDSDEPAFYSFKIEHEDDGDDLKENYCQATVYDQAGCTGKAFTRGGEFASLAVSLPPNVSCLLIAPHSCLPLPAVLCPPLTLF